MSVVPISSAVMTHPVREEQARELAGLLGLGGLALDPAPHDPPSALRTALVAWSAVVPGAGHHLVVQDDVSAPQNLLALVGRAVERFPNEPLVFYTNWHARNGSASRLAALAGASWVRAVPEEFTPSLAVCLPVSTVAEFTEFARDSAERHDDEVLSGFFRTKGRMALLAVPNVVEHIGTSSINGHAAQGIRLAVCPLGADDADGLLQQGWVLEELDWLPYMRYGEGYLRLPGQETAADGGRGHIRWRDALPAIGASSRLTEERIRDLVTEQMPLGLATEVARSFGPDFAEELWIHCLMLGRQAAGAAHRQALRQGAEPMGAPDEEAIRRLKEAAVSTVGPAGLSPERRPEAGPEQTRLMTEFAWTAIRAGERLWES
ncbi:hypothetical protein [Streptomyces sp. NBC_00690]|uniref:hypothetical protein n=1 Tax=Streptomyces sp. NBC_00690 TaxID=2975808 RepID=UPI002E29F5F7|nr:hypothetical protein [Streptomyces sp. NBC_00690]